MNVIEFKTPNGLTLEALELDVICSDKGNKSLCYCQNRIFWYNKDTLESKIIVDFAVLPDLECMLKDTRELPF